MPYLLHHLLAESAFNFPGKEAVRFNGQGITYAELDELTNKLAATLHTNGVKRGDRVAIYLNKSLASVICVFGIMKAGCVYVPLDPNAPVTRLNYIIKDCDVSILLTSTKKLSVIQNLINSDNALQTLIQTDGEPIPDNFSTPVEVRFITWSEVQAQKSDFTEPEIIETDLAYILYTSGSTGVPKGVMISHRTIFTFVNWCYEKFKMNSDDRVTSHAPLHFDLSTFDIYVTIKAGGTIVLVPENLSIFPVRLADLLQNERITVTYLVPSILTMMVNYGNLSAHDFSSLRTVLFAGEVMPIKYLRQLVNTIPHPDYYNLYGPTETNVCTYYKVLPEDVAPDKTQPVPIGRACENTEVFAVNDDGELVTKPGEEGELWVRGSCVAQGYWNDSEKTEKVFVYNIFQPNFGGIAYRTGDIVTLHEDGMNWLYIGRKDNMVKSRGYRIELGEIETVLYNHDAVKEAAVVAFPDDILGNRLKAFVVLKEKNGLTPKDLEKYCGNTLPRYMIPESFEFTAGLPKTSTGKVDRTNLVGEK